MTDELVKRLRANASWGDDRFSEAADRIEQLTAERDGLLRCVTDNHVALCRAEAAETERDEALNQLDSARYSVDVLEQRVAAVMAERDRLRALLAEADRRIAWEAHGFGNDFAERVEAAMKGETP